MAGENINRRLNIYINDKEVVNSLGGITREISKTQNQLKHLNKGSDDYNDRLAELTKHLSDLKGKQSEFKEELTLTNNELGAARNNFSGLFDGLRNGDMKAVQESLLGMKSSLMESGKAFLAFVSTPTGILTAGIVAIGAGLKVLWDYNSGLTEMNNKLSSLGVSSESLSQVRSEVQATAETFDKEFNEIAEKANSLSKTYGISMSQANDIIAQGLADGGALNDEFLDSLGEYDEFFAKAGYSAQEFINVINTGYDLGIYQDKLPDALKEADLALKEQTKTTRDALINAFGASFTDDILKKVRTGEMTTKEALDAIAVKSKEAGLSQQQQAQLTADLFKGAGEDAGGAQKILDAVATSAQRNMSETAKATDELREANERLNVAQAELFEVKGFGDMWTKLKAVGIDALASMLEYLSEVKKDIQPLIDLVGVFFVQAWNAVQLAFSSVFEIIGGGIRIITNAVTTLVQFWKKIFEGDFKGSIQVLADGFVNFGKIVANVFIGLQNTILTFLSDTVANIAPVLEALGIDVDKLKKKLESWKVKKFELRGEVKVDNPDDPKWSPKRTITKDSGNADQEKEAADAAKRRAKELADAKKHSEDLLKIEQDLQKQLLASKRAAEDMKLGLIKDDYERERAILNTEYDRKIEDAKANIKKEQDEINKLKAGIASSKTSAEDLASFKRQLAERKEIQANYNAQLIALEQTRDLKLGALHEKYLQKDLQDQEQANARAVQNLKTRHANELNSINSLQDAKAVLSNYLSEEKLKGIHTLDDAKKKLQEQFNNEELNLQRQHLTDMMAQVNEVFAQEGAQGIQLISPEEREMLMQFLDEAAAKLAGLQNSTSPDKSNAEAEGYLKSMSGIDLLGFTPEQWQGAFDSIDTFAEKFQAITMVVGAVQKAFGMYFQFLEAGERRQLQQFEIATKKKKNALNDQLEKGYITQEVYNARNAKLDQELAKKKAEMEYKQAKRQKAMQAAQIIASTAMAIMGIWAQFPKVDFGATAAIMSGVVGALGAVQLATVLAQPLPDKNGFMTGGYTGDGPASSEAGTVHKGEYVIPKNVLFSNDPVVPNVVSYLEAKRTGKINGSGQDNGQDIIGSGDGGGIDPALIIEIVQSLDRNSEILEKIKEEGLEAFLVNNIKTAKAIRDKIKELTKLETNAKA